MAEETVYSKPVSLNEWADFWRYTIGVNVIPADTRNKETRISWKGWQDKPIPIEQHKKWQDERDFEKGMAVILGKVWHRKDRESLYLIGIDADNQKAITEICTRNGKTITLSEFAAKTLVEQHLDNQYKAHFYFYSPRPLHKKSSDKTNYTIGTKLDADQIPAVEVKGLGSHGIFYCTPSIHKNGHPYEIIGTDQPVMLNLEQAKELELHIDGICRKYGLSYLQNNDNYRNLIPIHDFFKKETVIHEGHNRHEAVMRVMESLLKRNSGILTSEKVQELALEWNKEHCSPPLPMGEFKKQWKSAVEFMNGKIEGDCVSTTSLEFNEKSPYNRAKDAYGSVVKEELDCNIGELISDNPPKLVIAHKTDKQIKEAYVEKQHSKKDQKADHSVVYRDIILDAYPTEIEVIHDPFLKQTKYQITFDSKIVGSFSLGPASLDDIITKLQQTSLVYKPRVLKERLNAIINAYTIAGKKSQRTEIENMGFFFVNGKLVSSKVERKKISKEAAKEAVWFINELADRFYNDDLNKKRMSHLINIGVVAPFSFARRQAEYSKNYGWIPGVDEYGTSHAGKTNGTLDIVLGSWGLANPSRNIKAGTTRTDSRLALALSKDTFPVIISEADTLPQYKDNTKTEEILSMLKNCIEFEELRTINTIRQEGVKQYGLSYPIITRNSRRIDESGFATRFAELEFTNKDRKTLKQEESYNQFVGENLHKYRNLGYFVAEYVLEHPEVLKQRWEAIARQVLQEFYKYADEPLPDWLNYVIEIKNDIDIAKDQQELIRTSIINMINRAYNQVRGQPFSDSKSIHDRFSYVVENKYLAGFFIIKQKALLRISSSIVSELKRYGLGRMSLKETADLCGFSYNPNARVGQTTGTAIECSLEEFAEFIDPLGMEKENDEILSIAK